MDIQTIDYPSVTVNSFQKIMSEKILPERLKEARERLGISKTEAARRLNLSKIGYCRYEYGDRTPSPQTVLVIAQCFETSVDFLLGKTTNTSPDFVTVDKNKEPYLYELVTNLSNADSNLQKRVLEYSKKLIGLNRKSQKS